MQGQTLIGMKLFLESEQEFLILGNLDFVDGPY